MLFPQESRVHPLQSTKLLTTMNFNRDLNKERWSNHFSNKPEQMLTLPLRKYTTLCRSIEKGKVINEECRLKAQHPVGRIKQRIPVASPALVYPYFIACPRQANNLRRRKQFFSFLVSGCLTSSR